MGSTATTQGGIRTLSAHMRTVARYPRKKKQQRTRQPRLLPSLPPSTRTRSGSCFGCTHPPAPSSRSHTPCMRQLTCFLTQPPHLPSPAYSAASGGPHPQCLPSYSRRPLPFQCRRTPGLCSSCRGYVVFIGSPPATGKGTPLYFTTTHLSSKNCGK